MPKKKVSKSSKQKKSFWNTFFRLLKSDRKVQIGILVFLLLIITGSVFAVLRANTLSIKQTSASITGGGGSDWPCTQLTGSYYTYYNGHVCGGSQVYTCSNGLVEGYPTYCSLGCHENNLYTSYWDRRDFCEPANNPCHAVSQGAGGYCGANQAGDGAGGNSGWVYNCGGAYAHTMIGYAQCPNNECAHNPSGNDYCVYAKYLN